MKLITYQYEEEITIGAVLENSSEEMARVIPLSSVAGDILGLIAMGKDGLARAQQVLQEAKDSIPLDQVRLLAPLPRPARNIMCLGKNYQAHAEESNRAWGEKVELPESPIIFTKATTAVSGPFADIPYDPAVSTMIDYEAELALIIGREGKNIAAEEAMSYIFGYTVMNDISARDMQREHKQFFKGKSLDGSAPLGPWIVTRDDVADPQNLAITCTVNGELRQESNTRLMIFDIVEIIVSLSRGMTLLAGDIIATGTPSGVGFARTPPVYLVPGDEVTCSVEGVGTIRNRVAG